MRLAARLAQQGDRLGRGVLLAGEAGDEAAAANLAPRLEAPAAHQQIAPRRQPIRLARQQSPEHHSPAAQQRAHQVLHGLLAGRVIGSGGAVAAGDPRPASRGVHPEQRDAPPPPTAHGASAAIGGKQQGAQPREAVGVHQAERHQLGQRFLRLRGQQPGPGRDLIEEGCAVRGQILRHALRARRQVHRVHRPRQGRPQAHIAPREQHDRRGAHRRRAARRIAAAGAETRPHETTGEALLIEPGGFVLTDAVGQDLGLPGAGRRFESFELRQDCAHCVGSLHAQRRRDALPLEQEAQKVPRFDRFDLRAQAPHGVAVDSCQQPAFAPLSGCRRVRGECAAHREAFRLQRGERGFDPRRRHGEVRRERGRSRGSETFQAPANHLHQRRLGAEGARVCRGRDHRGLGVRIRVQGCKQRQSLGRHPQPRPRVADSCHPLLRDQGGDQPGPVRTALDLCFSQEREPQERIVQLVRVGGVGPGFLAHAADGIGIEPAEVGGALRIEPAPAHHRLGAPLLQRRVIEKRVRSCGEHFQRERRGLGQIARDCPDAARLQSAQQPLESLDIHRLFETVADRLAHQRMIRNLELAREILGARDLVRKHRAQQVFRRHARQRCRHLLAAPEARQGECDRGAPAPAHRKHGRGAQRLHQQRPHRAGMKVTGDLGQLEAVRRRQRQHDGVLGRRRLQLEVERAAEALAQGQSPGAIDATAEGRVNDQLHAAGFVEEAFENDGLLGRQRPERGARGGQIVHQLPCGGCCDARLRREPLRRRLESLIQPRLELQAQPRDAR